MNPTTAFVRGNSIPLPLPLVIVQEILRNGKSITRAMDVDNEDSPGHIYRAARGYIFTWGHVREEVSEETEELEDGSLAEWHFSLDSMLAEFQKRGSHLSELADVAAYSLYNIGRRLPEYIDISDGDTLDAFSIYAFNNDIPKARKWIARKFIPEILPKVLKMMKRHLDTPDPKIPLREPPCCSSK